MTQIRVWRMVTTWTRPLWRPVVRWKRVWVEKGPPVYAWVQVVERRRKG